MCNISPIGKVTHSFQTLYYIKVIKMDLVDDYADIGEIYSQDEDEIVQNTQKAKKSQGRGGDIDWIEVAQITQWTILRNQISILTSNKISL